MIKKLKHFFKNELWKTDLNNKSTYWKFLIRQVRVIAFAFKGFFEDRAALRATSLTYFTMLSIIPILALAFGIASGFGFEDRLNQIIDNTFSKFEYKMTESTEINTSVNLDSSTLVLTEETMLADSLQESDTTSEQFQTEKVLVWIKDLVSDLLHNTSGGLMAGIGFFILFWSIIQVLNNIELSFNDIWQIKKARSPIRKFSDYLAIMILAPFVIVLASSYNVKIRDAVEDIRFVQQVVKLIPYVAIWLMFFVLYVVMPNTKVKPKYAIIAGIFAGTLSIILKWAFFEFQIGVTRLNPIYGSFVAIPLILLYLQLTWLIVLMGAELCFAYQNIESYELESEAMKLNHDNKRILSLVIAQYIVKNFEEGGLAKSNEQISHKLGIPLRLVNDLIFEMVECGILAELATDSAKERKYQPAVDIHKLTVDFLYTKLEKLGGEHLIVTETAKLDKIMKIHEHMMLSMTESPSNILIKDI